MIRTSIPLTLFCLLAPAAFAADYESVYTRLDHARDCKATFEQTEGNMSDRSCPGIGDYGYVLRATDGRESVTFGFADGPGMATFGRFNYANGTVEWRVPGDDRERPVAAIQRWFLADADGKWTTQILVVFRVGQPDDKKACVTGYIDARDSRANERARERADQAAGFACGTDKAAIDAAVAEFVPPA